jgi:hypothetical protein
MGKTDSGNCPEAIGNHQDKGDGTCSFCSKRFKAPPSPPKRVAPTELGQEYRRHYDPDYGTDKRDT